MEITFKKDSVRKGCTKNNKIDFPSLKTINTMAYPVSTTKTALQ